MGTELETITVVAHGSGEGAVWRCSNAEPAPAALLMCDIRRGRPLALRRQLCERILVVCEEVPGIDPTMLKLEFTQHTGDETFHPHLGGFNSDWTASERD